LHALLPPELLFSENNILFFSLFPTCHLCQQVQQPAALQQPTATSAASVAAAAPPRTEASPFLDPLVRSLILGVGAGMLCETGHVLFKVGIVACYQQQRALHSSISSSTVTVCIALHWAGMLCKTGRELFKVETVQKLKQQQRTAAAVQQLAFHSTDVIMLALQQLSPEQKQHTDSNAMQLTLTCPWPAAL
jgi:hypothetical protein